MTRPLPRRRAATLALICLSTFSLACKDDAPKPDADAPAAPAGDGGSAAAKPAPNQAKPAEPLPEIAPATSDSAPIADHGQVVATVQLPTGSQLSDLSPIVEKFAPGTSPLIRMQFASVLGQALGMQKFNGAKLSGPVSLIAVDPSLADKPLALLVEVEDAEALGEQARAAGLELRTRDQLGLIGPAAVVAAAESYAFEHLASYPDHTEIVIYPASMVGVLGPQIDELLATMDAAMATQGGQDAAGQEMMRMYAKAFVGAIGQTERAVLSFSQGQSSTDLHAHLYPVADTTLASFIDAQVPADHALLQKLPASGPQAMVMSGEMRAGAAKDTMLAFSLESMGSMYGGETSKETWMKLVDAWLATVDGEVAATMEFNFAGKPDTPGMRMQGLFGVTDAAVMFSAWRAMLETMVQAPAGSERAAMMGMNVELSYDKDVLEHEGVSVDRYSTKIDLASMPEAQREAIERMGTAQQSMHLSAFDSFGALVSAGDEGQAMTALIDAARGKAPTFQPAPGLSASLATSTERGESFLFYFDLSAVAPPDAKIPFANVTMAMGKHENALALRLSAS